MFIRCDFKQKRREFETSITRFKDSLPNHPRKFVINVYFSLFRRKQDVDGDTVLSQDFGVPILDSGFFK